MVEYSKKVLSELNRLKKTAFKAAQDTELEQLYRDFEKWKKKESGLIEWSRSLTGIRDSEKRSLKSSINKTVIQASLWRMP